MLGLALRQRPPQEQLVLQLVAAFTALDTAVVLSFARNGASAQLWQYFMR